MTNLQQDGYENLFKSEFKRLIGRTPNSAEMTEMQRRRGIYTIREIIDMVTTHDLPIA